MDEYLLRPALAADEANIRRTIRRMRLNPFGLDWRRFVVIETAASRQFAACGQVKTLSSGLHELASLAVLEAHRGQGLAGQIIRHLLAREPARPLYLTCRAELRGFYEKFGFRVLDLREMPSYYRLLSALANFILARAGRGMLVMSLEQEPVEKST